MKKIDWKVIARILETMPNLIAAWVFGSAKDGYVREGGELDIGVLFESFPSLDERAILSAQLQEAFDVEDIDLLVLNAAGPIVRFEAVNGRAVFCRDKNRRAEFVSLTAREYEDEMAFLHKSLA